MIIILPFLLKVLLRRHIVLADLSHEVIKIAAMYKQEVSMVFNTMVGDLIHGDRAASSKFYAKSRIWTTYVALIRFCVDIALL